jgi:hypothetical protein
LFYFLTKIDLGHILALAFVVHLMRFY